MRRKGTRMTEEGTLSIVQRGQCYQVRYASNNPYGRERRPRVCPDEAHLAALLHHCGTEAVALSETATGSSALGPRAGGPERVRKTGRRVRAVAGRSRAAAGRSGTGWGSVPPALEECHE
jgi:hypothetical protein